MNLTELSSPGAPYLFNPDLEMSLFSKLSLSGKIYAAIGVCLLALVGSSMFAVQQINKIGKELEAIAEDDLPLTVSITEAAASQLEQTIYFERMLKSALEREMTLPGGEKLEYALEQFHSYGDAVDTHLEEAKQIAFAGIEHASNDEMRAKFVEVDKKLGVIIEEHKQFEAHAEDVEKLLTSGEIENGISLGEQVDEEAEHLDQEIEKLLKDVAAFTAQSAVVAEQHEKSALRWLIIVSISVVATIVPLTVFIVQVSLPKPLRQVLSNIDRLASDQLDDPIAVTTSDEIGRIAKGLEGFRLKLVESRRLEEEVAAKQRETIERSQKLSELNKQFESAIGSILGKVSSATEDLNATAASMSASSEDSAQKGAVIMEASNSSSQNMQSVGSASEEMSASIGEIASQTRHATEVAEAAVGNAESVRHKTNEMVENAQSINDVVALISGIAEQTNLLALNATIEAARAGESGKGFAVVAAEVKDLANQTARATSDISEKIEAMQSATQMTAGAIENILSTIRDINEVIMAISSSVAEQDGAVAEINRNIQMASDGSLQINAEMETVSSSIRLTGDSAHQVQAAVTLLREESEVLTNEIRLFLENVKAA